MTKTLPVLNEGCSVLMIQWEHGTYTHPFGSEDKSKQNILNSCAVKVRSRM